MRSSDQPRRNNPSPSMDSWCNIAKAAQREVPISWPLMERLMPSAGNSLEITFWSNPLRRS